MIDLNELKEKAAKSIGGNESLEKQFDFFAPIIAEFAPVMPDVWQGGGVVGGKKYQSIKLCWRNKLTGKWIELSFYDSYAGNFNVDGNPVSIKALSGTDNARAAFESAFRYVFGGK